ncbi:MAG: hypothetical protein ACFFBD_14405 [Candidatus Hodarchaeota archaeon]
MTKSFFIQGLSGVGLVGLKVVETLNSFFKDIKTVRSYSEFFPSIATVINGRLRLPNLSIYHVKKNDLSLYTMTGDQPRNPILTYFFLEDFEKDLKEALNDTPLDLYIAFGANMMNFNPDIDPRRDADSKTKAKEVAQEILEEEIQKPREISLSCSTDHIKSSLIQNSPLPPEVTLKVQSLDYVINGLNGVLPSFVTQKLGVPSVAAMIETSLPLPVPPETPLQSLRTFLGLCSARRGVQWAQSLFGVQDADKFLEQVIERLKETAIRELSLLLRLPSLEATSPPKDNRMYV